jgi:hypothetical protein
MQKSTFEKKSSHLVKNITLIQLLEAETNKYYSQYSDTLDNDGRCSQLPGVTVQMYVFLALLTQMGHDVRNTTEKLLVNSRTVLYNILQ